MCGRFTNAYEDWSGILDYFGVTNRDFAYPARYNIAPGQDIPTIVSNGVIRRAGVLRWGLIPSFAKDEKIGYKTINARAETVMEKPMFRRLVARKRCVIVADGFYEWKKTGTEKQPMRIVLKDRPFFSFAGLYDTWVSPSGQKVSSCTILTTEPNELMQDIHDRMPVILPKDAEDIWLNTAEDSPLLLQSVLAPYPADFMRAYPVHQMVGSVRNDLPQCIEALA